MAVYSVSTKGADITPEKKPGPYICYFLCAGKQCGMVGRPRFLGASLQNRINFVISKLPYFS